MGRILKDCALTGSWKGSMLDLQAKTDVYAGDVDAACFRGHDSCKTKARQCVYSSASFTR